MPELPEVETTKNGLTPLIVGKKIMEITLFTSKLRKPLVYEDLIKVKGCFIDGIRRRAKYLILSFENSPYKLLIHLGMSGILRVLDKDVPREKHEHAIFTLNDGSTLRYRDARKFGLVALMTDVELASYFKHLGPEPLSEGISAEDLYRKSRGKKIAIKAFIMDQENIVGVGNIYATEALFLSCIHPEKPAQEITKKQMDLLLRNIQKSLEAGIAAGGTTLKDFSNPNGSKGYFQLSLQVYKRKGEPCFNCGSAIESVKIAGRTSAFCPKCQKK